MLYVLLLACQHVRMYVDAKNMKKKKTFLCAASLHKIYHQCSSSYKSQLK